MRFQRSLILGLDKDLLQMLRSDPPFEFASIELALPPHRAGTSWVFEKVRSVWSAKGGRAPQQELLLFETSNGERQDVNLEWKPCLTTWVRADETRLQQVLMNLLTNGIKYCRTGGTVKVTVTAAGGRVTLNVTDNGIGMTADQLARLFQPFDRLGQESSRIEGIGLGLVITKALLEQMDGTIGFESQPRVGTVVRVTLPLASRPSQQRLQT